MKAVIYAAIQAGILIVTQASIQAVIQHENQKHPTLNFNMHNDIKHNFIDHSYAN